MPKLDRTGPNGSGAGTGRGQGFCGGGRGNVRGLGQCYGNGYGNKRFISPKNELIASENEENIIKEELATIQEKKSALKGQQN